MRWDDERESTNVEDRRGMGPVTIGGGGAVILIIIAVVYALATGKDPSAGIGNFGETYKPALAPDARARIIAGVERGFLIEIQVDEHGHATAVTFVRGPGDPQLREQLRQRLMAANYIPAECNGLQCAGTFDLPT